MNKVDDKQKFGEQQSLSSHSHNRKLQHCPQRTSTSKVILIVLVLYFLVPPTGDYTDVITHINPRKNQCKPWGNITQENNKNKIIYVFPQGRSAQSVRQVGHVRVKVSF